MVKAVCGTTTTTLLTGSGCSGSCAGDGPPDQVDLGTNQAERPRASLTSCLGPRWSRRTGRGVVGRLAASRSRR